MRFDWDAGKAAGNRRKHGVSFDEAQSVLPTAAVFEDYAHSERERRYLALGFSEKGRMLMVAFAEPEPGVCRIISARRATKQEQQRYAQAKREAGEA